MTTDTNFTCIRSIKPGMKQINIIFIVLEIGKPTITKDGHQIRRVKVADKTGSIDLTVWDEYGAAMQAGDIIKMNKGYAALWKDSLTLYSGKVGEIQRVDDFCMAFVEVPNMSEPNSELVKQMHQRMNGGGSGGGPGGGGGGGPSQEQQPPDDNSGAHQGHQQQPARSNVNRSMDPRSGAGGKMTNRNGHGSNNNNSSGGDPGTTQNNPNRHHHQQHHHHNKKPYPPKKPLGNQNSQVVGGSNATKEGAGATTGPPQQLQGILKR